jgi:hypothetical protein
MRTCLAAAFVALLMTASAAWAEQNCNPYCDFVHYYGPFDFSYVRSPGPVAFTYAGPGLFLYPRCGPSGTCSPYLISSYPRRPIGRVIVRSRSAPRR